MDSPEIELDKFLDFIRKHSGKNDINLAPYFKDSDLRKLIDSEKPDLGGNEYSNVGYEIDRMRDKLVKDGYIGYWDEKKVELYGITPLEVTAARKYYLTYEGKCFEGYSQHKKNKEEAIRQAILKENMVLLYSKRLSFGTRYLWIVTALFVLVELIRLYYELHPVCPVHP